MVAHEEIVPKIILRPVSDDDREFLLDVYASGREIELAAVPWDDAMKRVFVEHQYTAQDAHYKSEYPGSTHEIIVSDGESVGRMYLHRTEAQIAILDMAVLPRFRKRGVAATLVKRLQDEAVPLGQSIRVFLESFNPASEFFARLGFVQTSDDGVSRRYDWLPDKRI